MAGLVGYIGEHIESQDPGLINSMIDAIKYVDTDRIDKWTDGHLTIARVHHGVVNPEKQPIFNENGSLFIFMDGEVYGYEDEKQFLIKKGHQFKHEQNDAEFCLHLYEEFGEESFVKLNGSFLIAIYNLRAKQLILVNDRFSSYPLFYNTTSSCIIFGAQLKAIIQSHQVPRNLDPQAIIDFFAFHRVLGTKTYYKDIKVMVPASILEFQQAKICFKQYWEMNFQDDDLKSKENYVEALADTLKKAVKRRTNDNRRYGILLSGGLDSRTVLAASDCPMIAFTLADFENRELKIAKQVSEYKGCAHVFLKRDFDHYVNILDEAVELGDGMYCFNNAHFAGFLNKIKEKCDIMVHGCFIDTIYKGFYLPKKRLNVFGKRIELPKLGNLSEDTLSQVILQSEKHRLDWDEKLSDLFTKEFCTNIENILSDSVNRELEIGRTHAKNCYNKYDYFFTHFPFKLWSNINIICIRHFIDEVTIAFDNDLFELYLRVPPELRFNGRVYKRILDKIDSKIAQVPNANTGLPPVMSEYTEFIVSMSKKLFNKVGKHSPTNSTSTQGSWPNFAELIRRNDKLRQTIWDVLNDDKSIPPTIFNKALLKDVFNMHLSGKENYTWYLFLTLTFGTWYKKYGPA